MVVAAASSVITAFGPPGSAVIANWVETSYVAGRVEHTRVTRHNF